MNRISRKRSRANTDVGKFFTTTEQIRVLIEDLQKLVDGLKNKHAEILAVPLSNDNRNQQLEEINFKIKSLSQVIRSKLKVSEKSIHDSEKSLKDVGVDEEGVCFQSYTPAALRIQKTQIASLVQKFTETMTGYQLSQVNYRDQLKNRLKRQLEITNSSSSVSEEDIDNWIEKGKISVFTKSIIFDSKVMEDVQTRHNDLIKLEKSIRDLNELFKELAQHVESQGHIVNSIEQNVKATAEFSGEARRHLNRAAVYQSTYHKKKAFLLILGGVTLALLIMGAVIYVSVIFSK